jgi:hypothetical protein
MPSADDTLEADQPTATIKSVDEHFSGRRPTIIVLALVVVSGHHRSWDRRSTAC